MIVELVELEQLRFPSSDALGPSTFHCGEIAGGEGYNIVTPKCTAVCSVRVAKDLPKVEQLIEETIFRHEKIHLNKRFMYLELYLDHDIPEMDTIAVSFGNDAPRLKGEHKRYIHAPGTIP